MRFVTNSNRNIEVRRRHAVGRGGEGVVLNVVGAPDLVAKLFHQPTPQRRSKLEVMIANPPQGAKGRAAVAWPLELLFTTGCRTRFAGYLMPKLKNARPIFECYNPKLRRTAWPQFDYRYLVRTARNLAATLALVHDCGCVVGDSNESNVFAGPDARVSLIDADSWQVMDPALRKTYRCTVGKSEFLAPEIQGRNLETFDRLPSHDNFSLAVLMFKLTHEGAHPFDGVFRGSGEPPPVEKRIVAGIVPAWDRTGMWSPKPLGLPIESLHEELRTFFVRCFSPSHAQQHVRPSARAWQELLTRAERELRACPRNPHHWHWGERCIWCERAALLGRDPFPVKAVRSKSTRQQIRRGPSKAVCPKKSAPVASPPPAQPEPQSTIRPFHLFAVLWLSIRAPHSFLMDSVRHNPVIPAGQLFGEIFQAISDLNALRLKSASSFALAMTAVCGLIATCCVGLALMLAQVLTACAIATAIATVGFPILVRDWFAKQDSTGAAQRN